MKPASFHSPARRRALSTLAAGALGLFAPSLRAAPAPLVVLTSYPDDVVARMESAFEAAHPGIRLQIVWRMPHDALPYLRQPKQGGVDVYWSASPRNFAALAQEGAWQKLGVDFAGLPAAVGKAPLRDVDGYYSATEMAGYGFVFAPQRLAKLGLAEPRDWPDLADPRWAGQIALPNPARVGFAPVMVDIVLQAWGWEKGWALWSAIAGNAALLERGSTFVTDEVAAGRRALGLTIDFFAASAIKNGAPLRFAYPAHSGINPAHVAITAAAAHVENARQFVAFVLSEAGQKLITHPDIRKLPVRPSVYANLAPGYFSPFAAAECGVFDYDSALGQPRIALVAALFQQMLAENHRQLVDLWQRLHRAEAAGKPAQEVRRLLETPPLSAAAAADEALLKPFRERREGAADDALTAAEIAWGKAVRASRTQAAELLDKLGA